MNRLIKFHLALLTSAVLLSACTTSKDAMMPKPEKNMKEVYETHMSGGVSGGKIQDVRTTLRRPLESYEVDLAPYSRTESNLLTSEFTFLPNPVLIMYVAPHLSTADGVPIPGYVTQFRMYEKDHYALPHEMVNYTKQHPVQ